MMLPTTFSLAALLLIGLAVPVVVHRARLTLPFGDGGDPTLTRAIRSHANLTEYAPVLLALLELADPTSGWLVPLAALRDPRLDASPFLPAAQAAFFENLDHPEEARAAWTLAATRARSDAERSYFTGRAQAV